MGLINYMGLKTNVSSKKNEREIYTITNVIMKNLSKNIKQFGEFPFMGYVRNMPKHEPTDRYFYLAIQLANCMMRYDASNQHVEPVIM